MPVSKSIKRKLFTLLAGSLSLSGAVLAAAPSQAQSFQGKLLNEIYGVQLTAGDMEELICITSGLDGAALGTAGGRGFCKDATNNPEFYASNPGYYLISSCGGGGANYAVGNYFVLTGRDRSFPGIINNPDVPTLSAKVRIIGSQQSGCNYQGQGTFQAPPGFVYSATSGRYILLTGNDQVIPTVPRLNQPFAPNSTYAASPSTVGIFSTRPPGDPVPTFNYGITLNPGTTFGTDFDVFGDGVPPIPANRSPQGGSRALANPYLGGFFSFYPQYDAANHPEKSFKVGVTGVPVGYTGLGYDPITYIAKLDRPTMALADNDSNVTLTQGETGNAFVFTRGNGGSTANDLPVRYTVGGTAANGTDIAFLPGDIVIPAGQSSVTVPIYANPQSGTQPAKTVTVALEPSLVDDADSYLVPSPNPAVTYNIPAFVPANIQVTPSSTTATPGANNNGFTITRSGGSNVAPLTVNLTPGGSATAGTDYSPAIPTSVAIPAGQDSVFIPVQVPVPTGSTPIPEKTITVVVASGTGYNIPPSPTPSTLTIPAYNPATLDVQPSNATFTPGAANNGFTITRAGGDQTQPLTVNLTPGGTATPGTDYTALPTTATIPAGQPSVFVPATVPTQTGSTAIPAKTVTLTPAAGNGYALPNPVPSASATIPAYTPAAAGVTLQPTNATFTPGGANNGFTVTRSGPTDQPLTVNLTPGGTATSGTDYAPFPGSVTIPVGASSAVLPVNVPAQTGTTATPAKTLNVTLAPGTGYAVPSPAPVASANIPAYNPAVSTLTTSSPATTLTPGATNDGFTITRSGGDQTQPLTVGFTPGGTATPGTDYAALPATVTIPAGQPSVFVPVSVPARIGATAIPAKSVDLTLSPGTGYTLPSPAPMVNLVIPAYDPGLTAAPPTVSFDPIANPTLTPGTTNNDLVVTRTGSTALPLTVPYTTGGTGTPGTDYTALPGSVTIPAGASSAVIPVTTPGGATPGKTLQVALSSDAGFTNGANPTATYTVGQGAATNPETSPIGTPTVSVVLDPSAPALVFTRTPEGLTNALTVGLNTLGDAIPNLDYVGLPESITFPGGQSEVRVPITLLPGATSGRTLTSLVKPGEGYTPSGSASASYSIPSKAAQAESGKKSGGGSVLPIVGGLGAVGAGVALLGSGGAGAAGAAVDGGLSAPAPAALMAGGRACGQILQPTVDKLATKIPELRDSKTDWDAMRFGNLKYQGQPLSQVVSLGETEGVFNLHCLTLEALGRNSVVGKMTLDQWAKQTGYIGADTTLKGLAANLYKKAIVIADIDGLPRFLAEKYGAPNVPNDFAEMVKKYGNEKMGGIVINNLPGTKQAYLGDLVPNWKTTSVNQVTGLPTVSFRVFPTVPFPTAAKK